MQSQSQPQPQLRPPPLPPSPTPNQQQDHHDDHQHQYQDHRGSSPLPSSSPSTSPSSPLAVAANSVPSASSSSSAHPQRWTAAQRQRQRTRPRESEDDQGTDSVGNGHTEVDVDARDKSAHHDSSSHSMPPSLSPDSSSPVQQSSATSRPHSHSHPPSHSSLSGSAGSIRMYAEIDVDVEDGDDGSSGRKKHCTRSDTVSGKVSSRQSTLDTFAKLPSTSSSSTTSISPRPVAPVISSSPSIPPFPVSSSAAASASVSLPRVEWKQHGSLIYMVSPPTRFSTPTTVTTSASSSNTRASSTSTGRPIRFACFDMDGTLIRTSSGRRFPNSRGDWTWLYPNSIIVNRLRSLEEDGYTLVIFTNQGGIGKGTCRQSDICGKIDDLRKAAKLQTLQAYIATREDPFRKPGVEMWRFMCNINQTLYQHHQQSHPTSSSSSPSSTPSTPPPPHPPRFDYVGSFYVGDAAGRHAHIGGYDGRTKLKKDFSCSDRKFAHNIRTIIQANIEQMRSNMDANMSSTVRSANGVAAATGASASATESGASVVFPFYTPEEFFLHRQPLPFDWGGVDPTLMLRQHGQVKAQTQMATSHSSSALTTIAAPPSIHAVSSSSNPAASSSSSSVSPSIQASTSTSTGTGTGAADGGPFHSSSPGPELILLVGSPAAGKSSFVRRHLLPHRYVHVNQDTLKSRDRCVKVASEALQSGHKVVVDNTNPSASTRALYIQHARKLSIPVRCFHIMTSDSVAKHLNMVRERITNGSTKRLPGIAFSTYRSRFEEPRMNEGFKEIRTIPFVPTFDETTEEGRKAKQAFMQMT